MMQSLNFKCKEVCNPFFKPLTKNMTKTWFLGHPPEMRITALFVTVSLFRLQTLKLNLCLLMTKKTALNIQLNFHFMANDFAPLIVKHLV